MSQPRSLNPSQPALMVTHGQREKISLMDRIKRFLRDENTKGYLYISPWFIGFILFGLAPMLTAVYNSFTNTTLLKSGNWVGWKNYQQLFTNDPVFWDSITNMVRYLVLAVPLLI